MQVSVIIPAYNEEEGIKASLDGLQEKLRDIPYSYEVIVVDDGSVDRTAEILQECDVRLLRHPCNMGYGAALKTGIREAGGEVIVIIDADGTYPAEKIPVMLDLMYAEHYDMVVGARIGKNVNIPLARRPAKWLITRFASYLAGVKIPDLNSGLRVFRKEVALKFFNLFPNGFSFTTTITLVTLSNGYKVWFEPIDYLPRSGKSKIKPLQDTLNFIILILRTILYFQPLRVFGLLSLVLFALALFVLLGSYFFLHQVMDIATVVIAMSAMQVAAIGLLADLISRTRR